MHSVPTITPQSITGIGGLQTRPIFFIKLNGSPAPTLVVKGEAASHPGMSNEDAEISIAWGSKLMKNVQNRLVNTKLMTPGEIQVFKAAAQANFANNTKQFQFAFGGEAYKWVKMPFVANLTDASIYTEGISKNFNGGFSNWDVASIKQIKETIRKLSNDDVWRELGKVVAVDIFNGNNDRFVLKTGFWQNHGNVMFVTGGATPVIGLDTFDPNSQDQGNLNKRGGFEELKMLIDAEKRRTFAEACAKSVGDSMKHALGGTTMIKVRTDTPSGPSIMELPTSLLPQLFLPFAETFDAGIKLGADALKTYLQGKARQTIAPVYVAPTHANRAFFSGHRGAAPAPARPVAAAPAKVMPKGVLDRMIYLGW